MKNIKNLLFIIAIVICFVSCKKQVEPKQEYIPIYIDADTERTFYVASPSGIIVFSTDSETYYQYINEDGRAVNIMDYMEAQNEKD